MRSVSLQKGPEGFPWGEDSPKMVLWEMGPYQLPNLLLPWSHTSQPPKSGGINFLLLLNCLVYGIFSDQSSKPCIQPLHSPALPRATEMLKGCSLWQAVLWEHRASHIPQGKPSVPVDSPSPSLPEEKLSPPHTLVSPSANYLGHPLARGQFGNILDCSAYYFIIYITVHGHSSV